MTDTPDLEAAEAVYLEARRIVDELLPAGVVKVLDIKAGTQSFQVRAPTYVIGVDVLQAERGRRPDADEHRVLDLEKVEAELERDSYDIVLCVNVLEHARDPRAVLQAMGHALKSGGVLVLELPNVVSVKGIVTRLIPWRLKRWLQKRVLHGDTLPARSVHSFALRPKSMLMQARSRGWRVEYFREYEGPTQRRLRRRIGMVGWRWRVVVALTRVVTLGLLTAEETGIIAVFTKLPLD
jgi:SAM-dependent methyltransferase